MKGPQTADKGQMQQHAAGLPGTGQNCCGFTGSGQEGEYSLPPTLHSKLKVVGIWSKCIRKIILMPAIIVFKNLPVGPKCAFTLCSCLLNCKRMWGLICAVCRVC